MSLLKKAFGFVRSHILYLRSYFTGRNAGFGFRKFALLFVLFQVIFLGLFFVGSGMAYWMFKPAPTTASQLVASWRWYGMMRPDANEIQFLRARLPHSLTALRSGLTSPSDTVRECTAIAIAELGADARALLPRNQ